VSESARLSAYRARLYATISKGRRDIRAAEDRIGRARVRLAAVERELELALREEWQKKVGETR
jgi:hypothetical protein